MNIKDLINNKYNSLKKNISSSINNANSFSELVIYFICFIIIALILIWIYNIYTLDERNCNYMNQLYINNPVIYNINPDNEIFSYRLYDYYIKTAYNCCSAGSYKNDFVNLCALKNCIKYGARCLDMQIYSLNDNPVVATSLVDTYTTKETYNSLPLSSVLSLIYDYAFNQLFCQNWKDPLIIHFRIMSNNKSMYDKMAYLLKSKLKEKILGSKYSYENHHKNIGAESLINFINKIIIIVDKSNPVFMDTKLNEYVNLTSNSPFMRLLRYTNGIKYASDDKEIIDYNKTNFTMCLPDLNNNMINPSFNIAKDLGCQMVGMAFQNNDVNLQFYNDAFSEYNYSFILKPIELRHIPVEVSTELIDQANYLHSEHKKTMHHDHIGTLETII